MLWPTLHTVGLTPRLLQPEEYREVLSFGLGLIDNVRMSTFWLLGDTFWQHVHGMDMFDADMVQRLDRCRRPWTAR